VPKFGGAKGAWLKLRGGEPASGDDVVSGEKSEFSCLVWGEGSSSVVVACFGVWVGGHGMGSVVVGCNSGMGAVVVDGLNEFGKIIDVILTLTLTQTHTLILTLTLT